MKRIRDSSVATVIRLRAGFVFNCQQQRKRVLSTSNCLYGSTTCLTSAGTRDGNTTGKTVII